MTFAALKAARPSGFRPPAGRDRCPACGWHTPTQGHPEGCPREAKR